VANHQSDPEKVIAFMQYFTLISMAMMSVTRMFVMFSKSSASANRIAEVLDTKDDLTVKSENQYPAKKTDVFITFENVSFSYKGKYNNLKDITLSVPKGGSLGIIGATGSGKSTLIKLLIRFYDVTSGAIRIDGQDIRTIPREEFFKKFGIAMQHDFLYADTVEENIKFGRELSHEDVVRAAKIAQADDFIQAFPDGYEHMLSQKGTNVSGGQKQRILISRAVAARPEILILDDSSSALDYKTDANLRRALAENLTDTTVITVAQRVSSVKNCNIILVLDEGHIIGLGTHDELMEKCPEYKEISDSQMGGAIVE
jgi:ATP-binding cassette subfamily B protein